MPDQDYVDTPEGRAELQQAEREHVEAERDATAPLDLASIKAALDERVYFRYCYAAEMVIRRLVAEVEQLRAALSVSQAGKGTEMNATKELQRIAQACADNGVGDTDDVPLAEVVRGALSQFRSQIQSLETAREFAYAEIRELKRQLAASSGVSQAPPDLEIRRDVANALKQIDIYEADRKQHSYQPHQAVMAVKMHLEMALGRVSQAPPQAWQGKDEPK